MIPLHVHSNFSLLRGAATVEQLVMFAKEHDITAMALTDDDSMQGFVSFVKAAHQAGIKPILGTTITLTGDGSSYVICLAKNNTGYSELCRLITRKKLLDDFSLQNIVSSYSDNLIYISPSINVCTQLNWHSNVFFELRVFDKSETAMKIPVKNVVYTNPVYFLRTTDFYLHKIISAIRERKTIESVPETELANKSCSFENLLRASPIDIPPEYFTNSRVIAGNCNAEMELGKYKFPVFPVNEDETTFSLLYKICMDGLHSRYTNPDTKTIERMHYELEVISELNFVDYFLVVWDIVKEAKRRGMMMIGRGSAANSLVSYCLGFTEVDPIKYDLYFERFLNKSRTSPPDVDLDFSWKERDEIVKYVFEKYGYERVAMISTIVTFRARSAFRETAKVFGYSESQISQYSKFIPWTSAQNLERLTELFPEARNLSFDDEKIKQVLSYASKLAGFPRHLSIHPSGIVITPEPITNYTALDYAKNKGLGIIVTQPDMYAIEEIGLVKIDLLSQRSLGVLRTTLLQLE
ncbi:MAG: DNA polymerase III subunit alpha [Ignavibacteriales bacterium]|nr:DNA polymerase III subunit alpha [Ignavibacteriales bacterium]